MKVDASWLDANAIPPVVIAGSGPAGTALAMRLSAAGIDCLVLEAGGEVSDERSQDYYRGAVIGDPYFKLHEARLCGYGGTSGHWTGRGRPMEEWDFEKRPHMPYSGWPFGKDVLDPYEEEAYRLLMIPSSTDRSLGDELFLAGRPGGAAPWFGYEYDEFFEFDERVKICFETAIEWLEARDGRVTAIHLRDLDGNRRVMRPKAVVIAAGGLETNRILLWSNAQSEQKVVPFDDLLGRCWMEHPTMYVGTIEASDAFFRKLDDGTAFPLPVAPTREAVMRNKIGNGTLHIYRKDTAPGDLKAHLAEYACKLPVLGGRLTQLFGRFPTCSASVIADIEQAPDPSNRVVLSATARDAYGQPRIELHWKRTEQDYRTARVLFELLGRHLVRSGAGRARATPHTIAGRDFPEAALGAGWHHMGGCRMSASQNEGVVDPNLKVHGIDNVWITGSAVYPNAGYTNPTLAIVQLSLRLGDHLAKFVANRY